MTRTTDSEARKRGGSGSPVDPELDAIVETLRETMNGSGRAKSLFVTGSAVTGEWAADHTQAGWYFYSDLDLGVICESRDPAFEARLRDEMLSSLRRLGEVRSWCAPPETKVAFFSVQELMTQAPKPGTLEMINQGRVLWGDRAIRDHFPPLTVEDLTWEEAIRLLGNRVLELLENPPGDEIIPMDYYRISKLHCDFATSLLIPEGAYVAGYRQRAARLPALVNDRPLPHRLRCLRDRLIEAVEFWTEFRIAPSMQSLRARYDQEPLGEEGRALVNGIWCEARLLLEATLEALLPYRLLDEHGRPSPHALSRTSGWGTWRQRVREWRWLAEYGSHGSLHVWRRGVSLAFRLSPVEITYLIAFILFTRSTDGPPPCYLNDELVENLAHWYPLPHEEWTSGEEVRAHLLRLWRYWLPRI